MARNIVERELSTLSAKGVRFEIANEADDADIRRLLRENPMPGRIGLSFEREPDYFADASLPGETKQTIVARNCGRIVCTGSCTVRQRFVNGQPRRVGYLGGLRLDKSVNGRFDILRGGYDFFHSIQGDLSADFYFTSIATDNERARRLLERSLPGMPRYEFAGEFVTLLLPAKHDLAVQKKGTPPSPSIEQLAALLNHHNKQHQLAPCWSLENLMALKPLGLGHEDFRFYIKGGKIGACVALWDQRVYKQAVIRSYKPALSYVRPALNVLAHFTGRAKLPAQGGTLANAFVSHLATEPHDSGSLIGLFTELRAIAAQRGIELITAGFAANDPRLAVLRNRFRGCEYYSRLYLVRWSEDGKSGDKLDTRILAPEVALL